MSWTSQITLTVTSSCVKREISRTSFDSTLAVTAAFIKSEVSVARFGFAITATIVFVEDIIRFALIDLALIFERTRTLASIFVADSSQAVLTTFVEGSSIGNTLTGLVKFKTMVAAVNAASFVHLNMAVHVGVPLVVDWRSRDRSSRADEHDEN